jgi:hypothetical protein
MAGGGGSGVGPAMGATPTIVPFSLLGTAPAPGGGGSPAPGRAGGGAWGGGGELEDPGRTPGWFIMSIVPLNFGAAALLRWKLHFAQV